MLDWSQYFVWVCFCCCCLMQSFNSLDHISLLMLSWHFRLFIAEKQKNIIIYTECMHPRTIAVKLAWETAPTNSPRWYIISASDSLRPNILIFYVCRVSFFCSLPILISIWIAMNARLYLWLHDSATKKKNFAARKKNCTWYINKRLCPYRSIDRLFRMLWLWLFHGFPSLHCSHVNVAEKGNKKSLNKRNAASRNKITERETQAKGNIISTFSPTLPFRYFCVAYMAALSGRFFCP